MSNDGGPDAESKDGRGEQDRHDAQAYEHILTNDRARRKNNDIMKGSLA